jgi:hypothetical protein
METLLCKSSSRLLINTYHFQHHHLSRLSTSKQSLRQDKDAAADFAVVARCPAVALVATGMPWRFQESRHQANWQRMLAVISM